MRLVEVFDIGIEVMPRKARRLMLVALLLLPGGAFINWYVQEKAAVYEEVLDELLNDVVQRLLPPRSDTLILEGPAAV
ncbi:MAG: hypothetical protein NVV66_18080 [Cellulomonas sp.]|uniref:hypothetical protein n=1 Tax=Cellulomonas sp. TaxID=40001 RepID=UPI002590140B|nr:hypothetical protein [Cellulomonas sp.]MCR6706505.1 hypothetical protein [Cellulomonas sp.]